MRAKSVVLICIALGCGLVASIGISQVIDGKSKKPATEMVKIFVASKNIDIGEPFTAKNVRMEPWPKKSVPETAIVEMKQLKGRFARNRLYIGEPINKGKVMGRYGGLWQQIPKGYRVCTVKVNMVSSISNLIKPGDRVDIVAILRANREIRRTATKLVLEAVRVFAVNAQTQRFVDQNGKTIEAKTISVLVKNSQVARLMMASELGTLRLTLRGHLVGDEEEGIDQEYDVSRFLGGDSEVADDESKVKDAANDKQSREKAQESTEDLAKFLRANQPAANAAPKAQSVIVRVPKPKRDVIRMEIVGPNGSVVYAFDSKTRKRLNDTTANESGDIEAGTEDEVDSESAHDDDNKEDQKETAQVED